MFFSQARISCVTCLPPVVSVMAMGFTQQEARLALRLTEGNIQLAIAHIMKRKEVSVRRFAGREVNVTNCDISVLKTGRTCTCTLLRGKVGL